MEILMASGIGVLTATGVYLLLRPRSFDTILGLTLLSYAVNLFIFASGRLVAGHPPIVLPGTAGHADPLPQALVLTAIVISFGMTALLLVLALRAHGATGSDALDDPPKGGEHGLPGGDDAATGAVAAIGDEATTGHVAVGHAEHAEHAERDRGDGAAPR